MKNKGLIIVFTGDGKGKTTAALGTAVRMLGRGKKAAMVQFFKGAKSKAQRAKKGSSRPSAPCPMRHAGFKVWSSGGGFTWRTMREENRTAAAKAWQKCIRLLRDPKYSLLIFDEINIALKYKFLKTSGIVKALKKRPAGQHVILTGRGAPRELIKAADLVTEMRCVKHPFACGIPAQPGLDF